MPGRHFLYVQGPTTIPDRFGRPARDDFRSSIADAGMDKRTIGINEKPRGVAAAAERHLARQPTLRSQRRRGDSRLILQSLTQADNTIREGDAQ
jgi:hypothetical protein